LLRVSMAFHVTSAAYAYFLKLRPRLLSAWKLILLPIPSTWL
jgi:hypothetical protein